MKITSILLLVGCLQVAASGYGQKVSLRVKDADLQTVLKDMERQTGYSFFWEDAVLQKGNRVTIDVKDLLLEDALNLIFKGQQLDYVIKENVITIVPRKNENPIKEDVEQLINIRGQVTNEKGLPVLVNISVKGTNRGTTTNDKGEFHLNGVSENAVLVISGVGIETKEVKVNGLTVINVVAKISTKPLDEVQIIAFGETTRRISTSSVVTISSKELKDQPVTNFLDALQGRVPGLTISTTSGVPGARTVAQIRGQNNLANSPDRVLNAYDQPLFIVDGVPMPLQNNALIGSSFANSGGVGALRYQTGLSSINGINPLDIESISILKDADATSIYGSQGSNGVILITTKRAKTGSDGLTFSFNSGFTNPTKTIPMMNTTQFLAMREEALKNSGVTAKPTTDPDLLLFDQNKNTDWMREFFGGTARRTDIHASLSGGSVFDNYMINAGYTRSTYNFPGDMADSRYNIHTSYTHQSANRKFKMDFGTDLAYNVNNNSGSPASLVGFTLTPNFPDLLDASGKPLWSYNGFTFAGYQGNPLASMFKKARNGTHLINSHLSATYFILPYLNLTLNAGYARQSEEFTFYNTIASQNPLYNPTGLSSFGSRNTDMINIVPQLNFNKAIGKGVISVLAGGTYKKNYLREMSTQAYGYVSDALLNSVSGSSSQTTSNAASYYKYLDVFTRINFRLANKYIFNLTGNRDGSSNFGPDKRYANFGSAGAAWIVSEENWLKGRISFLSFLKLSVNYGIVGSDGVAPYQYQANWRVNGSNAFQGVPGYNPQNPFNPVYAWASNNKFNQQIDLGFFKDRLLINFNLYQNKSSNQLVAYLQPIQTGFNTITTNAPYQVNNSGWELSLSSNNLASKDFLWSTSLNVSRNINKLADFPDLASSPYASSYVLGKPLNVIRVIPYEGVNPQTGLFQFRTASGAINSMPQNFSGFNKVGGDQTALIDINPRVQGGLGNTFSYKNISLNLFFQFSIQKGPNYLYNIYSNSVTALPGAPLVNQAAALLGKQWQKPGDQTNVQKFVDGFNGADGFMAWTAASSFSSSTGAYSDASYIRLKTASISYKLPEKWMKKVLLKNCSFYVNAQNLFVITGYELGDPETMSLFSIPPQKTVVMGINASF